MYGGVAINPFRRSITKCTWFSLVCTVLNKHGSAATLGGELQASFARSADYILHCWMRATVSRVPAVPGELMNVPAMPGGSPVLGTPGTTATIKPILQPRWTQRLGHNLIVSGLRQKLGAPFPLCTCTAHKKYILCLPKILYVYHAPHTHRPTKMCYHTHTNTNYIQC